MKKNVSPLERVIACARRIADEAVLGTTRVEGVGDDILLTDPTDIYELRAALRAFDEWGRKMADELGTPI